MVYGIGLPLLRTSVARRCTRWLARFRFGVDGLPGRSIDRVLMYAAPTVRERAASTDSLVELFFALVDALGTDTFIEAGAKEANASLRAIDSGVAEVVAFEANPYTFERFESGLHASGLDYRHAVLTDRAGEARFLVRRAKDGSPIADGKGSLLARLDQHAGHREVSVRAATLDGEITGTGRVAMWIDVEGAVAEVIGGAASVLNRTDVVIVEVESTRQWTAQRWLADDVERELRRFDLLPVARDIQSRWQYNIVFVRDERRSETVVDSCVARWKRALRTDAAGS